MAERDSTTIRVYEEDRKRISAYGLFGESFADVVKRILDEYEEYKMRESGKINPCEAVSALALA
jgi:hypothetical protein